ncbi:MAG: hypothetical protein ACI9FJ_000500 [Alteromonadaceae bacterium]|jgi:hypothetical protein
MKKYNLLTKSLFTLTFIGAINAPIVNSSELTTADSVTSAVQLTKNAQHSLNVSLKENLNLVITSINVNLKKDLTLTIGNEHSLVVELASSQSIKDDKIIGSVSE